MKSFSKDIYKEIINTKKRFLSILIIVLLGVGFFAGIKATSPDMEKTVDKYFDDKNVFDIEVISTLGLTKDDIEEIKKIDGVEEVEGSYSKDILLDVKENEEIAVKIHSISDNINLVQLLEGRMPENENECLVEETFLKGTNKKIGDKILLKKGDKSEEETKLDNKEMTIVGTIMSPQYISRERGSTKLATGKINSFIYVPKSIIEEEYFTEINVTVSDAKKLNTFGDEYENKIKSIKDEIEKISEERKEKRYQDIKEEATKKVKDAEKELEDNTNKANQELQDGENKLQEGKNKLEKAKKDINKSEAQLVSNKRKANQEFANAEEEIKKAENLINVQEKMLLESKQEFPNKKKEAEKGIQGIKSGITKIDENLNLLKEQKKQIEAIGGDTRLIDEKINELEKNKKDLVSKKEEAEQGLIKGEEELKAGEEGLKKAKAGLAEQKKNLEKAKKDTNNKIYNGTVKINNGKKEIEKAEAEIVKNEKELEKGRKELEDKINDANKEIQKAKDKVNDIKRPLWYILDRNQNIGFAGYKQDTERIENIAKVFPVVFFIIATLISLTSMTKMVEEQRTQIGTLKALGYTKYKIASKYVIYAILATTIGGIIGMLIGFNLLPNIIIDIYKMMYTIPDTIIEFNVKIAIIGLGLALICTVGATIIASYKELRQLPAPLMRPKAPKPGKRVLLERINFIWSKMNFTHKVTVRNIFRYKKRVSMTVIGILGCTALMVAGFGLRDSISNMIPQQYGEIFKYNANIAFKNEASREKIQEGIEEVLKMEEIEAGLTSNMQAVEILNKNNKEDIQLIVPEKPEEIEKFILLENRKTKEKYELDNEGIIITEKIAKLLKIKVGDSILIKNADDIEAEVKVTGITRNYLLHYIYISPELYKDIFKEDVKYNTLLALEKNKDIEKQEEIEDILGKEILKNEDISKIGFISESKSIFDEVMENMTFVVWILIISAGLLAFVVLYNLANINISERIRELATIKVLGFYDKEVYQYVARETVILTIIGILLGLLGGYFLNMYILKTCELDILMFDPRINITTYLYSAGLTILFTTIVNITTYFALKKIDMIESLKSVE